MKKSSFLLGMSLLIVTPTFAQDDLVPATTDDIGNFDSQLSDAPRPEDGNNQQRREDRQQRREDRKEDRQARREERREERKERREERREDRREDRKEDRREDRKDNFGQMVKEKAQELRDMPKGERPQMGGFVSEQRRQNGQQGHGRQNHGAEGGANSDSRLSAPSINDEGKPDDREGGGSNRPPRPDRPHSGQRPPKP